MEVIEFRFYRPDSHGYHIWYDSRRMRLNSREFRHRRRTETSSFCIPSTSSRTESSSDRNRYGELLQTASAHNFIHQYG